MLIEWLWKYEYCAKYLIYGNKVLFLATTDKSNVITPSPISVRGCLISVTTTHILTLHHQRINDLTHTPPLPPSHQSVHDFFHPPPKSLSSLLEIMIPPLEKIK